jgi:hypothetical protein
MVTLLERNAAIITTPRGVSIFVALVLVSLGLIRVFLFPGVGGDDSEQLVFSQFISWGYQIRNPPLVTWLLIGVQKITGPTVLSIVALRMAILFGIYLLTLNITRRLCDDPRLAALSAGSLLMVFYMGWNTIHGFTHTSLVTFFYLSALLMVLRIKQSASPINLGLLGVILGIGLLAKYSFLLFAIALLCASLADQDLRRKLMSPWLLFGFVLILPLLIPQAQWLIDHAPPNHLVRGEADLNWWDNARRFGKGTLRLMLSLIGFLLPLWIFWLAVFWKAVRSPVTPTDSQRRDMKLFKRLFIILLAMAVGAIFVIQSDRIRSHYMFILIPFVPYFFLRFGNAFTTLQIQRFAAVISLAGVTLIATLIGKYFIEPLVCGTCEDHIPYDSFAKQVRDAGFKQGTIFAFFHKDPLAGNFRVRFPDARVVSAKHPAVVAPKNRPDAQCLIIWPVIGVVEPKSATLLTANQSYMQTGLSFTHPSTVITAILPPYRNTPHQLEFILLNEGAGNCR